MRDQWTHIYAPGWPMAPELVKNGAWLAVHHSFLVLILRVPKDFFSLTPDMTTGHMSACRGAHTCCTRAGDRVGGVERPPSEVAGGSPFGVSDCAIKGKSSPPGSWRAKNR